MITDSGGNGLDIVVISDFHNLGDEPVRVSEDFIWGFPPNVGLGHADKTRTVEGGKLDGHRYGFSEIRWAYVIFARLLT